MSVVLLTRAIFCAALFYVICVFCLLVVLVRLSVPVQVIDWKDSSLKCNVIMTNLKRRMQHKRLQGLCTKIVNNAVNNTVKLKERIS